MAVGLALGMIGGIPLAWMVISNQLAAQSLSANLALLAAGALVAAGALIFMIGLALYVIVPSLDKRRAAENYGSHRNILACLALAIAISLVLQSVYMFAKAATESGFLGGNLSLGLARGAQQMLDPEGLVVSIVTLELSLLAVMWIRVVRPGVITWSQMGLTRENLGRGLLYGLATGVAIFIAAAIVELVLTQTGIQQTQMRLFSGIKNASLPVFALVVLAGGPLAGFAEESFFRGFVFQAYREQKGLWQAFLFSSLIFGIVHLNLPAFLPIFVMGFVLAYAYSRTRSVIPSMIGHAMNNTIAFIALYWGAV